MLDGFGDGNTRNAQTGECRGSDSGHAPVVRNCTCVSTLENNVGAFFNQTIIFYVVILILRIYGNAVEIF